MFLEFQESRDLLPPSVMKQRFILKSVFKSVKVEKKCNFLHFNKFIYFLDTYSF